MDLSESHNVVLHDIPEMFRMFSGIHQGDVNASVELEKDFRLEDLDVISELTAGSGA